MKCIHPLAILTALLFFSACAKKTPDTAAPVPNSGHSPGPCSPYVTVISDPALLSCKYKAGSYWLFKDSLSGNLDTHIVDQLNRTPYLISTFSCDTLEYFEVRLSFKKENITAFKSMLFQISRDKVTFYNDHVWEPASNANALIMYGNGALKHDSLKINGTVYKNVYETGVIGFLSDAPNLMEPQSLKIFFNPDLGPLQMDRRDRVTGQLKSRYQLVSSQISR